MCKYKTLILRKEKQVEYGIYSLHINIYVRRHIGEMSDTVNQTSKNCSSRKGTRLRAVASESDFTIYSVTHSSTLAVFTMTGICVLFAILQVEKLKRRIDLTRFLFVTVD